MLNSKVLSCFSGVIMSIRSFSLFLTNWVLKISDDVIVTSFLNQSQHNFVFLFVIFLLHLCAKFEQNRTRNKEVAKNAK